MDTKYPQRKLELLNHGYVRLIDHMGSDLAISRAARTSYDADWRAGENKGSDARLIDYLWRNKHTSPFEAVQFTFEVKAPIFVFRQWHRHRTWSFSEVSGRYAELPEEYFLPDPWLVGEPSKDNKQVRDIKFTPDDVLEHHENEISALKLLMGDVFARYHALIDAGWPRELARTILPLGTYSRMFASVNLLNLLKFISLRDHEHAQYEIRVYAEAMRKLIQPIVPVTLEAFDKHRG